MQTSLYGLTIEFCEYTADWRIADWGDDEDAPVGDVAQADYMLEFYDDINNHVISEVKAYQASREAL